MPPSMSLVLLFGQIALILALSRLAGLLFARLRQPQVMGEMLAGILLGPSLLGWAAPGLSQSLFPPHSHEHLRILSQIGVVFFLFLVGLDLDPTLIRRRGRTALAVSIASIAAPFLLGALLVLWLWPEPRLFVLGSTQIPLRSALLFMGAAMSITAFPVLARILTERGLHKTSVGGISIACAAFNDAAAWTILAFVVAAARYQGPRQALVTTLFSLVYILLMFLVVRPFLRRLEIVYERQGRLSQNVVAIIFLLVLASALTAERIGLHALFGAFLMGAIMPKDTQFVRHLSEKLEDYAIVLLLPIFFAYTGLHTRIGLLNTGQLWLYAALFLVVACAGKFGGSAIAARLTGAGWREASAIGILMNTRGLMELVILAAGRELGVINDELFAIMVLVAILTTLATTPILQWVYPSTLFQPLKSRRERYSVLIPVALPKSGGPLVQLADTLIGPERDDARVYALHLRPPVDREAYRSGLDEAESPHDESLAPLVAQARGRALSVEPISFLSRDVPADIAAIARAKQVDLVLMGFHKPVIGKTILGGTVHRVLENCPAHVAIFVDRGFRIARRVLVPYLGSPHDHLALELAARMARNNAAMVTVLHVVPPLRGDAGRTLNARDVVDRTFQEPGGGAPVTFRVVEDPSPVGVVLHQAQQFDLIVVGVAEEWGLESHLFGWRPERIARDCPCSLLIVRRHGTASLAAAAQAPAPPQATTP